MISTRRRRQLILAAVLSLASSPAAAERHVAIILDTSQSMAGNDSERYTMQLSQILADLVETKDQLSVIGMADSESCSDGPSSALLVTLDPADRSAFKRRLDQLVTYDTGTYFAAAIRTAIATLSRDSSKQRLLLVIADAGGLGDCRAVLTNELLSLKASGATIAAINLGSTTGAFDQNPAFEFTTAALDSQGLIEAAAAVYQRFLGAKQVQTGRVQGAIEVTIAPLAQEAFLVVAADGPLAPPLAPAGNPHADAVDLNYRGGGETIGLDRRTRGYRIVRLQRPAAGRWRFTTPGLSDTAGWMLLQESSVGLRLVSSPEMARGIDLPVEVELYDQVTGRRLADTSGLPGLAVTTTVDGRQVTFRDDGQGGDRQAGDGILTATTKFGQSGSQQLQVRVESDLLDRRVAVDVQIIDATWRLVVATPGRAEVTTPVSLTVELQPIGSPAALRPPDRIDALTGGPVVALRDDGRGADRRAGDRIYTGSWTPRAVGPRQVDYVAVGGSRSSPASAALEVLGRLVFGPPRPVRLGQASSGQVVADRLDLGSAEVHGSVEVRMSSPFEVARTALEIDAGNGWVALGRQPIAVRLDEASRSWPLRLRVGECPGSWPADRTSTIVVEATDAAGRALRTELPLSVIVVPDSWLRCWWPVVVAALALLVAAVLIHGYWSPSRFAPRLGVVMSPEDDMSEGFFHPIRAVPGSRSGFYRDARIYISGDYRLSRRPPGAVARLRADAKQVRIQPLEVVWRQNAEGEWEQIPPGESTARFGDLYRNDRSSLFFEIRNA